MVQCKKLNRKRSGAPMTSVLVTYIMFFLGYFFGGSFYKRALSISYPLFVALLMLWGLVFFVAYGVLAIERYNALAADAVSKVNFIVASNFVTSFFLGLLLSFIVLGRVRYYAAHHWLGLLVWLPVVNVATLFIPLGKDVSPRWVLNKLNANTILTFSFALFLILPHLMKNLNEKEVEHFQRQRVEFVRLVSEEVLREQALPYSYDIDGFLLLNKLVSSQGVITLILSESRPYFFAWENSEADMWFKEMLCEQWKRLNTLPSQPHEVGVAFEISDASGKMKWQRLATPQLCDND